MTIDKTIKVHSITARTGESSEPTGCGTSLDRTPSPILPKPTPSLDTVLICEGCWEWSGETKEEKERIYLECWQDLVDSGMAWTLQSWFGRRAKRMIECGLIAPWPRKPTSSGFSEKCDPSLDDRQAPVIE